MDPGACGNSPQGTASSPPTSLPGTPYQQGYCRPTPSASDMSTGLPSCYRGRVRCRPDRRRVARGGTVAAELLAVSRPRAGRRPPPHARLRHLPHHRRPAPLGLGGRAPGAGPQLLGGHHRAGRRAPPGRRLGLLARRHLRLQHRRQLPQGPQPGRRPALCGHPRARRRVGGGRGHRRAGDRPGRPGRPAGRLPDKYGSGFPDPLEHPVFAVRPRVAFAVVEREPMFSSRRPAGCSRRPRPGATAGPAP